MTINGIPAGFIVPSGVPKEQTEEVDQPSPSAASSSITDSAAERTAGEITDAVVNKISRQLNVGNTGYSAGVAPLVRSAILNGLRRSSRSELPEAATPPPPKFVGGSYQNEILKTKAPSPEVTPPPATGGEEIVVTPPQEPSPIPNPSRGRGRGRSNSSTRGKEAVKQRG